MSFSRNEISLFLNIVFIFTSISTIFTILSFFKKWSSRFQLIGVTLFSMLLSIAFFFLTIIPLKHGTLLNSSKYNVVYDNGSTQIIITVPLPITQIELQQTLKQAANDLWSPGRLTNQHKWLSIKARTFPTNNNNRNLNPIYLGEIRAYPFHQNKQNRLIFLNSLNFK
uniref:Uncharacterized protein n=1 Tax=Glaucocystis incrassata TaxID=1789788 RepID=A0A3G1IVL4_9EUKA|nr:hypothetical protein Ycf51 [Glaucocystis incrassata]ASQ40085.1 hypothetical protein Ycf51 [Glaucocystis incrassata]